MRLFIVSSLLVFLSACGGAEVPAEGRASATDSATAVTSKNVPSKFQDVPSMMEEFGDFSPDTEKFKWLMDDPPSMQLGPWVNKEDDDNRIGEEVNRALLYGVYRTFIHTDLQSIKVVVVPLDLNMETKKVTPLPKFKQEIFVERGKAEEMLKRYGIGSFSEAVGTADDADQWSEKMEAIYWQAPKAQELVQALQK